MFGRKLDDNACKNIIRDLGRRLNVDPKLIVTRLFSEGDKNDMRNGDLPINALKHHIEVWIKAGLPDYAHGKNMPMKEKNSSVHAVLQRDESIKS
jgi:chaperonin GroEL (HSP60 family)